MIVHPKSGQPKVSNTRLCTSAVHELSTVQVDTLDSLPSTPVHTPLKGGGQVDGLSPAIEFNHNDGGKTDEQTKSMATESGICQRE